MSYQIKSTPYFRRMLTTSKRNGQLQKLKEEYDQIKVFNEHSIEMKMRQVRLKRLFKEIEEIKETSNLKKRNLGPKKKAANKTKGDERLENLMKAKDLGQFFSRRNAVGYANSDLSIVQSSGCSKFGLLSQRQEQERCRLEEELLKARVEKRIKYGNDISSWNMYKLQRSYLRREISHGLSENRKQSSNAKQDDVKIPKDQISETCLFVEREKLKQMISYGNILHDMNLKEKPKKQKTLSFSSDCIELHTEPADDDTKSSLLNSKANRHLDHETTGANVDATLFKSCDDINVGDEQLELMVSCNSSEADKRTKAKTQWCKLAEFIKTSLILQRPKQAIYCLEKHEGIVENQLRYISNGTNLPQTDIIPMRDEQLNLSENEDEYNNEKFFNSEYLFESILSKKTKLPPTSTSTSPPQPLSTTLMQLKLKPVNKVPKDDQIKDLINQYASYSMDVVKKEIGPIGVQEMRRIYEHHNE